MLYTLGSIATISGLLVVLAYKLTLPFIEANQRNATEQAVFEVVPKATKQLSFTVTASGLVPTSPKVEGERVYAGYTADGTLQGIAIPGAGLGYGDLIRILYAYDPNCHCITGIKILKMAETPGIGDQIALDPEFLKNFTSLDATLTSDKAGLANPIVAVKHGSKTQSWQIDAISGATISSRGLAKALDSSANRLLPQISRSLNLLEQAGKNTPQP